MSSDPAILAALQANPAHFTLASAIAVLESSVPGAAPLGRLGPAAAEAVRLRPLLDLAFPTADVVSVESGVDGGRWRLTTTVLGLYGECSPLPTAYTEQLMAIDEPNAARALLDVINHRLLSFLYRSLVKYRLRGDAHRPAFAALMGLDPAAGGAGVAELLVCAGCFAHRGSSAAGLEGSLTWWFSGLPVRVETCVPTWTRIALDQRSRLGATNASLGGDALLGAAIRNRGLTVRVEIRPRSVAEMTGFLPGGVARAELESLVRSANPSHLDIELDLVIDGVAVAPAVLAGTARLGYDLRLDGSPHREHRIRLALAA